MDAPEKLVWPFRSDRTEVTSLGSSYSFIRSYTREGTRWELDGIMPVLYFKDRTSSPVTIGCGENAREAKKIAAQHFAEALETNAAPTPSNRED